MDAGSTQQKLCDFLLRRLSCFVKTLLDKNGVAEI